MANELNIALPTSGLTVTAQRYQNGAAVGSAISLSEVGSSGFYTGNMTGISGTYQLGFISAGKMVGSGNIIWSGTAEVPVSTLTTGDLPSVPSVVAIRQEMDSNSTKLANLDASVSSRLATSGYTAPTTPPTASEITTAVWAAADKTGYSLTSAERSAIATAVESSILNEADGQAVLNAIVGAIGNSNVDQIALVAAIRSDLERNGGKIDNVPSAAANASAVWGAATKTVTGGTVDTLTNSPSVPSAASIAAATRSELAVELARVDAAISTRATPANVPTADITAIKTRLDSVNVERVNNTATTQIVGTLLAQSQS